MSSWLVKTNTKRTFPISRNNTIPISANNIIPIPTNNTIHKQSNKSENNTKNDKNVVVCLSNKNTNIIIESSNKNAIDFIDAILYINLEHRNDRNEHCLNEIKKIDPLLSKVHRINAVHNRKNGALGCSLSHIKALELFIDNPDWKNCLILEDDFTFLSDNNDDINKSILYLLNNCDNYDVILLGIGVDGLKYENYNEYIYKITSAQTTSGYIFSRKYVYTLLANYTKSSDNMINYGWKSEWCLDQYWKKLMPYSNWYSLKKRIGYQYNNYSDIENKNTEYNC